MTNMLRKFCDASRHRTGAPRICLARVGASGGVYRVCACGKATKSLIQCCSTRINAGNCDLTVHRHAAGLGQPAVVCLLCPYYVMLLVSSMLLVLYRPPYSGTQLAMKRTVCMHMHNVIRPWQLSVGGYTIEDAVQQARTHNIQKRALWMQQIRTTCARDIDKGGNNCGSGSS
jgi:hypothetical protein